MSTPLKLADKSQNMEALRGARSYNDIVVVLSRIIGATSSIVTRTSKSISKVSDTDINIDSGELQFDRPALRKVHEDLTQLETSAYEVKYARSITHIVPSDDKLEKLNVMLNKLDASLVQGKNLCYKYLNEVGKRIEPEGLHSLFEAATKSISRMLPDVRISSFIVPDASAKTSIARHIVLRGITTKGGYALSEFLVALHARNNFDNTFSYQLSFPVRPRDQDNRLAINTKAKLDTLLRAKLATLFHVKKVKSLSDKSRRSMETLSNVRAVSVKDGAIRLALESGVTGSDINSILSKCLPIVHATFGVKDPRIDILHRVWVDESGSKVISFLVSDRNFYDKRSLDTLRRVLGMDSKTYTQLTQILGK